MNSQEFTPLDPESGLSPDTFDWVESADVQPQRTVCLSPVFMPLPRSCFHPTVRQPESDSCKRIPSHRTLADPDGLSQQQPLFHLFLQHQFYHQEGTFQNILWAGVGSDNFKQNWFIANPSRTLTISRSASCSSSFTLSSLEISPHISLQSDIRKINKITRLGNNGV